MPYSVARWIDGEVDIASLKGVDNAMIVKDNRDRTVVLISNEWQMGWVQERNPDVTFLTTQNFITNYSIGIYSLSF